MVHRSLRVRCSRLRICYLADAGSVHTQKWVTYFAKKGHDIHVLSLADAEKQNLPDVKLYQLESLQGLRGVPLAMLMAQIRRLIKRIKPDILHAHYVSTYGFWGALSMFHPFVLTAWGSDILITPNESRLSKYKTKFTLGRADLITCDATHLLNRMVDLGAEKKKSRILYFGVDTERFSPDKRDDNFKAEMGIETDSLIVISLRSLTPLYDVESLLLATPQVLRDVPNARLIIVGGGEQRDYLRDLAERLGIGDSVKFVGLVPNNDLPRYLASSDVYVSTSLSDAGIAASTAEAMACQLPVVITDVAENRNWVSEGEGGFIVPPKNPAMLAERIIYLLRDKTVRSRFAIANRNAICERNDYNKQMGEMERIYEELVGSSNT